MSLLVNWASGERRYEITQALAVIDGKARSTKSRAFGQLPAEARHALTGTPVRFEWVPRLQNSRADKCANDAMDARASFSR